MKPNIECFIENIEIKDTKNEVGIELLTTKSEETPNSEDIKKNNIEIDVNLVENVNEAENSEITLMDVSVEETEHNVNYTKLKEGKLIELSRNTWTSTAIKQQYLRGCNFSPDGTCILSAVNNDGMHVIELPSDLYSAKYVSPERPINVLQSAVHVKEGGTVYDFCWYPFMKSTMPETCCWIATRQHEPIHMWDAFNGELRCSYKGYDFVDEIEAAIAVTFSINGDKVIGGYKKNLKVFNTEIPGRTYEVIPTSQPISCFAVHETHNDTIATGSWNCTINLYDLRIPKLGCLSSFSYHNGGITYLKFNKNGESLFSGARKDNMLLEWDMRNFSKPLTILNRNVETNQRIYFDLTPNGRWLISGDTRGSVHIWDIDENFTEYQFALHKDCCNGVSFNSKFPIIATSAGQYKIISDDDKTNNTMKMYENSLILWWCGNFQENLES